MNDTYLAYQSKSRNFKLYGINNNVTRSKILRKMALFGVRTFSLPAEWMSCPAIPGRPFHKFGAFTTFLKHINFASLPIFRLSNCERAGRVAYREQRNLGRRQMGKQHQQELAREEHLMREEEQAERTYAHTYTHTI